MPSVCFSASLWISLVGFYDISVIINDKKKPYFSSWPYQQYRTTAHLHNSPQHHTIFLILKTTGPSHIQLVWCFTRSKRLVMQWRYRKWPTCETFFHRKDRIHKTRPALSKTANLEPLDKCQVRRERNPQDAKRQHHPGNVTQRSSALFFCSLTSNTGCFYALIMLCGSNEQVIVTGCLTFLQKNKK